MTTQRRINWTAVIANDRTVTAYIDRQMVDALAEDRMSLPEWRVPGPSGTFFAPPRRVEVRPLTISERVRLAAQRIARRLMP